MYGDFKQMVKQAKEEAELRAKQKDIIEMSVAELQIEVATLRERCAQLEIRLAEKQPTYCLENIKCANNTNEFGELNVK